MRIGDRVRHVGDVVDDADTHLHADDPFLDEGGTEVVDHVLPSLEAGEEPERQDPTGDEDADEGDDRPARGVHPAVVDGASGQRHHEEPEDHDDDADDREDQGDGSDLRPRIVEIAEVRRHRLDRRDHVFGEEVADLGDGVDRGDPVEPRDTVGPADVTPVVRDDDEVGDGLGEVGGVLGDRAEHRVGVGEIGVVGDEGQQCRYLGGDLVERERQEQVEGVGEVGFEGGEHVVGGKSGGARDELDQRTDLPGRAPFGVDDRVEHVGHAADHRDRGPVSGHPFLGERRPCTVEHPLTGVEAPVQFESRHHEQDHHAGDDDDEPGEGVGVPGRRCRGGPAHAIASGSYPTASVRRVRRRCTAGRAGAGSAAGAGS